MIILEKTGSNAGGHILDFLPLYPLIEPVKAPPIT
jgi:hypothetical protein